MFIVQFIKNILKRIFPPPVKSFMREVNFLKWEHTEINRHIDNVQQKLDQLAQENERKVKSLEDQLEKQNEQLVKQNEQLKRLNNLFESANRENLRIYFDARAERDEMASRYETLSSGLQVFAESNKKTVDELKDGLIKQQTEFRGLADESRKQLDELAASAKVITKQCSDGMRYASEAVWGEVFNNSIRDCDWLKSQTFSPGRWALGYPAMYVLFRVLNNIKPEHILELGLGQSTQLTSQYVTSNPDTEHYVVEHDPEWISFFQREFTLSGKTQIIRLDLEFKEFKAADAVRCFCSFKETFSDKQFDLIIIDAPLGGDMPQYARIDILKILPDCLADRFVILIDDVERSGERNTCKEICSVLDDAAIEYTSGQYNGWKSMMLICSSDLAFLTTM